MNAKRESLRAQGLTALELNWDVLAVLVLLFASFALYARTAAPGVLDGDFGEFQTNIYLLGVSHTGYPLYFLLAKIWTLVMPVGSIAFRANVFSGLFGALTLVILYFTFRTLGLSVFLSFLSATLFGVSRVQWSQAVIPDVYTLNSFFIVLVLWLAILWRMGRTRTPSHHARQVNGGADGVRVPLWWVALAFGFSLTHHRTMIWMAPALAVFVLWKNWRILLQPREMATTLAALFLPLLLYLYIPLRGASDVGVEYHASNFGEMILASNVTVWLRFGPPGFLWERFTQVYLALLIEQFTLFGFAIGLLGIFALASKRVPHAFPGALPPRQLLLLLGLAHIGETAFAIPFWVLDSEIFFIPSYLTFLFFTAIGLGVLDDFLRARVKEKILRRVALATLSLCLVVLCAYLVWINFPRNDQSHNDYADARWQEILTQPLEENALLVGPWEDLTPFEYYQYVENVRRDLRRRKVVIYNDHLNLVAQGDIERETQAQLENGTRVYFTLHPADTETLGTFQQFDVVPFASLWRVQPRVTRQMETRVAFGAQENLRAWSLAPREIRAGDFVTLVLQWSPDADLKNRRLVLRVRDAMTREWVTREMYPLGGREAARDGGVIRDAHGFLMPPDAPPGTYTLELAAFERNSQTPAALIGESHRLSRAFDVLASQNATAPSRVSIPRHFPAALNSANFLGYNVSHTEPRGGDVIEFSTWWQNLARGDDVFEITLRDADDVETVLYHGALFPTARGEFNPGQILRARQELIIPPQAAAGYARLLLVWNGQALPPLRIPLGESQRKFRAPIVPRPQLTLVGDAIQLLGYNFERAQYRAGENVPLTLYWSVNAAPQTSYKVFVHLVDAQGVLRAQRDAFPKNDTLPTNRWFAGEYLTDEYVLNLPRDLAPGEYRILVGMYDETSGARAPLFDAHGARILNDAVMLGDAITLRE